MLFYVRISFMNPVVLQNLALSFHVIHVSSISAYIPREETFRQKSLDGFIVNFHVHARGAISITNASTKLHLNFHRRGVGHFPVNAITLFSQFGNFCAKVTF